MQIENVETDFLPSPETNSARFSSAQTGGGDSFSAREARLQKARAYDKKRYAKNPAKKLARAKAYYAENVEKKKAYDRARRSLTAENRRRQTAIYYAENREKLLAYQVAYRLENREKKKRDDARYRAENPEKQRELKQRRRARKRCATVASQSELRAITKWQTNIRKMRVAVCYWCGNEFDPRPKGAWHMDHIVALSRGGKHSAENLCVSCPACNLRKNAKPLTEWSQSLPQPLLAI